MNIWNRIKQWAQTSDTDKVAMDRRAFLKGMTVTSAGLLIPGVTLFDMGGLKPGPTLQDAYNAGGLNPCGEIFLGEPRGLIIPKPRRVVFPLFEVSSGPVLPLTEIKNRRFLNTPTKPFLARRDYAATGRKVFSTERLPEPALPPISRDRHFPEKI